MKYTKKLNSFLRRAALVSGLALAFSPSASRADLFWRTDGTAAALNSASWSTTGSSPFTSAFVANTNLVFGGATSLVTGATVDVGNITVNNGSVVTFTANGTLGTGGNVRTLDVGTGSILDFSSQAISTAVGTGFTKNGAGILYTAGGSYTGGFTLNTGTVVVGGVNALGNGGVLTINGGTIAANINRDLSGRYTNIVVGGNFTLGGTTTGISGGNNAVATTTLTFTSNMNLGSANRTINIGGTGAAVYSLGGIISGTSSGTGLTITSSSLLASTGLIALTGTSSNTYSGSTDISSGILRLAKTSGAVAVPGTLNISGGSVIFSANENQNQIANTSNVVMTGGLLNSTTAFNTGSVAIQETIGSLTMSGNSGFATGTSQSGWTITNAFNITGGGNARFLVASSGSLNVGSLSLTAMTATPGATVDTANSFTIYGNSTVGRSILTVGSGGLTLNGSVLNMRRGTNTAGALGSRLILDGNVTTAGSATSQIKIDTNADNGHGTISVELSSTAGTVNRSITTAGGGADLTIGVPIVNGASGAAGITKLGPGTLTYTVPAVYRDSPAIYTPFTGGTTISEGTLVLSGASDLLATTGAITVNGGTLNLGGNGQATSGVVSFQSGTTTNGTLTKSGAAYDGQAGTVSAILAGGVGLNKTTSGILTLSGPNTYTGTTTVNAGKLTIASSGTINSSIGITIDGGNLNYNSSTALNKPILFNAGTLSGTGTINTAVSVGTGAKLSPGNSPGIQPYSSGLTWSNGGTYVWEVNSWTATPTAGTHYDQLQVTGSGLTISGLTAGGFTIDITGLDSGNAIGAVPSFDNTQARSWTILTANALTGAFDPNLFTLNTSNFAPPNNGGGFSLSKSGTNLILTYTPGTTYTLAAAPTTLNILKGGKLSATSTITNTGTGAADSLSYTGLTGQSADGTKATVLGTSGSGTLNNGGGNATQDLVITGVDNGSTTITSYVTPTPKNATSNTNATLSGSAGTINVVVGNASYVSSPDSASAFGTTLKAETAVSGTYSDLSSNTVGLASINTPVPSLGTTATIYNYTNTTAGDSGFVNMSWRSRTADEAATNGTFAGDNGNRDVGYLISDVVNLTGMDNGNGYTDTFILQMTYNEDLLVSHEMGGVDHGKIMLVWKDGSNWVNAVLGNSTLASHYYPNEAYDAHARVLGDYGIDPEHNVVWAVLDHNSQFAVIPEPSSLVLGGLALLGFAGVRSRRRRFEK